MKDEDRALTSEGKAQIKEVARGLARILPKVDAVYSSPLLRAMQTAKRIAKVYGLDVTTSDALRPGASTRNAGALLKKSDARRVILVGHEPSLTENLSILANLGESPRIELKKGGCYGIAVRADGSAVLEWILTPRVLRRLS